MGASVTKTKPQRVVGYIRVSTEEQATEGFGLEAQHRQIAAYCTMRGLELVEIVPDAGVSAGKKLDSRDGGQRVLDIVKQKKAAGVVAWKLDRLFRDCAECLTVVGGWDKTGAALHLVDMGGQTFDTSTAMGRFFLAIMAAAAELERNLIRERTRAGMGVKKAKGQRVGGVPFGFRLAKDGTTLKPDPGEQEVLKLMKRLRARKLSLRAIVEKLNERRVPARGRQWYLPTVAHLIRRLAVA